jgi:hypothetical protein
MIATMIPIHTPTDATNKSMRTSGTHELGGSLWFMLSMHLDHRHCCKSELALQSRINYLFFGLLRAAGFDFVFFVNGW